MLLYAFQEVINSEWFKVLNVNTETLKLPEANIGNCLQDTCVGKGLSE